MDLIVNQDKKTVLLHVLRSSLNLLSITFRRESVSFNFVFSLQKTASTERFLEIIGFQYHHRFSLSTVQRDLINHGRI